MPPKREIQVRFLLAVPTPAPFASQRGLFFCHAPNSPTPNSMTRPFRPSGRPSAQNANGSSFAPNPTPRGSRHVAPPHSTPGAGGRRLCARFPMREQSDAMTRKPCPPPPTRGGGSNASGRKNRRMGRSPFFFPPAPLFFPPPLYPFIRAAALLSVDVARRPIDRGCHPRRGPAGLKRRQDAVG